MKRHSIHDINVAHEWNRQKAATRIQSFYLKCMSSRRLNQRKSVVFECAHIYIINNITTISTDIKNMIDCFVSVWFLGSARKLSVIAQRIIRGWLARRRLFRMIRMQLMESHFAILVQKTYRGKRTRAHDTLVMPTILAFRAAKLYTEQSNATIVIQCCVRKMLAKSRRVVLVEDAIARRYSSILIQSLVRIIMARKYRHRLELSAELFHYCREKSAIRIQCCVRKKFSHRLLSHQFELSLQQHLIKHKNARKIQSHFRGMMGRKIAHDEKVKLVGLNKAAVEIQRFWRGCVPRWREIMFQIVSQHVKHKADFEVSQAFISCHGCYKAHETHHLVSSERESMSGDETDSPRYKATNDQLKYAFGHSYTKLRCKVYWYNAGVYYHGAISMYNERMRLWQVKYDDDDMEWLDLVRDPDRVMIVEEGFDIPCHFYHPLKMACYLEERKSCVAMKEPMAYYSKEQVISNLWFISYVSRGLLDEYYKKKSQESLMKLRVSHLVKDLSISIAMMRQICVDTESEHDHIVEDMQYFEGVQREIENAIQPSG